MAKKNLKFLVLLLVSLAHTSLPGQDTPTQELMSQPMKSPTSPKQGQKGGKHPAHKQLFISGSIYEKRGALDKAMDYYRKSLGQKPAYLPSGTNLAILYFRQGQFEKSHKLLAELKQKHPESPLAANNYALYHLFRGNKKKAVALFEKATQRFTNHFTLRFNLGTAYYKAQRFNNARKAYEKSLKLKTNSYSALNNLGCTLMQLKAYTPAEAILQKAIQQKPEYSYGHYNQALLYWRMEAIRDAEQSVSKALEINPNHTMARELKQRIQERIKQAKQPKSEN